MNIITIAYSKGALGHADGAEKGPAAVLTAARDIGFSETGQPVVFAETVVPINPTNVEETHHNIETIARKTRTPFLSLGGDHSVTYSLFKGFASVNKGAGLLVFDAHPDCMQPFSIATHENYLRQLIEDGIVDASRVVLAGLRIFDKEELAFLKKAKIRYYDMQTIAAEGVESICEAVMESVKDFPSLYVSVDIDAVDPGMAPGTGYPEPGGLTSRELLYFIHRLKNLKNIKAGDIVEVCPAKDVNGITVRLAARVLVEMATDKRL